MAEQADTNPAAQVSVADGAPPWKPDPGDDDMGQDAAGGWLRYRGRRYAITPLNAGTDFDELEAHLRSTRYDPVAAVAAKLKGVTDPEIRREFLDRAYRDITKPPEQQKLPAHEVAAWLDTLDGLAYSMHMQMARADPAITLAFVRTMLADIGEARGRRARDLSSPQLAPPPAKAV